jgi:hypothetical protein
VHDTESGAKLLILHDKTGFWHLHRKNIQGLKDRISALRVLSSEALLVVSRIAYQLKENQKEVTNDNILQILSF